MPFQDHLLITAGVQNGRIAAPAPFVYQRLKEIFMKKIMKKFL
jgi:hypothetical protein